MSPRSPNETHRSPLTFVPPPDISLWSCSVALRCWLGSFFHAVRSMKPAASQESPVIQEAIFQIIMERS